jgi:NarL family two-component system response regulator LiaR
MDEQRPRQGVGKREAIGVMIVDDSEAVRSGMATFLEAYDDLCLVGQASSGTEAIRLCKELKPDVVLMDLTMPGIDGIAATRTIRQDYPGVPVVGLTSFADQHRAEEAREAGAACCLCKSAPIDQLAGAIREAYTGQQVSLPPPGLSAP